MRAIGALLIAILVGIVAVWVFFKLLVGTVKLVGILIAVALAVLAYFVAERLIGRGR